VRDERVADSRLACNLLEPDLIGLRLREHPLGGVEDLLARQLGRPPAARLQHARDMPCDLLASPGHYVIHRITAIISN